MPGTAADDTATGIATLQPRGAVRRRTVVGVVPDILAPLPDGAVHVVGKLWVFVTLSTGTISRRHDVLGVEGQRPSRRGLPERVLQVGHVGQVGDPALRTAGSRIDGTFAQ